MSDGGVLIVVRAGTRVRGAIFRFWCVVGCGVDVLVRVDGGGVDGDGEFGVWDVVGGECGRCGGGVCGEIKGGDVRGGDGAVGGREFVDEVGVGFGEYDDGG